MTTTKGQAAIEQLSFGELMDTYQDLNERYKKAVEVRDIPKALSIRIALQMILDEHDRRNALYKKAAK